MAHAAPTAPRVDTSLRNRASKVARTDAQLLQQFLSGTSETAEAAFAALVERYSPIVHRVCIDVLGCSHEAQDAAQAVFLVLARKARSIRKPESLGPWMHGVAVRVARRAKSEAARRRAAERRKAEITHERDTAESGPEVMDHAELHEEINRLPDKYRQPDHPLLPARTDPARGGTDARLAAGNRPDSPASRPGTTAIEADTPRCRTDRSDRLKPDDLAPSRHPLCSTASGPRPPRAPRSALPPAKKPRGWSHRL